MAHRSDAQLHIPAGERRETPWLRQAQAGRFGIRKGEHLCGVCTLKRLWPTLFVEDLGELLDDKPARFVISTHTMALATSLDRKENFGRTIRLKGSGRCRANSVLSSTQPWRFRVRCMPACARCGNPTSLKSSSACHRPSTTRATTRPKSVLRRHHRTARRQTRNLLRADPDGRRPYGGLAGRQ
jgi:hypothetical protein